MATVPEPCLENSDAKPAAILEFPVNEVDYSVLAETVNTVAAPTSTPMMSLKGSSRTGFPGSAREVMPTAAGGAKAEPKASPIPVIFTV